jgi:hypothetical protein
MFKNSLSLLLPLLFFLTSCAGTATQKRTESVTIILKNGDKIEADVLDIWKNKVVFKAKDWKKAYEYGEIINIERIEGIKIADGSVLSVKEFDAFRKGEKRTVKKKEEPKKSDSKIAQGPEDSDLQYEKLKKKPISEMTENEFKYFIMMKEKELQAQKEKESAEESSIVKESPEEVKAGEAIAALSEKEEEELPQKQVEPDYTLNPESQSTGLGLKVQSTSIPRANYLNEQQLDEVAESLIEANLAPTYLSYLNNKSKQGKSLTDSESSLRELIERNPKWQEKLDDLKYLTRIAEKSLSRAYLYNPEGLKEKLNLQFDPDLDMDFLDLMKQLHRKIGEDVKMGDFRILVDVFGETGARAIKELLESYSSWQLVLSKDNSIVTK